MVDRLKKVFRQLEINKWRVEEKNRCSAEVFFVRDKLDMTRTKNVKEWDITLYVDFEEADKRYTGQTTVTVDGAMSEDELIITLEDAITAASFVKNPHFDLYRHQDDDSVTEDSSVHDETALLQNIYEAIFSNNNRCKARINSAEVFLYQDKHRVVNAVGTDVEWTIATIEIEVIADCSDDIDSVELGLYRQYGINSVKQIEEDVLELVFNTESRLNAKTMPSMPPVDVLIGDEAVMALFDAYVNRTHAQAIYEGVSTYKLGESIYTRDVSGDTLTIEMRPILKGGSQNAPYDNEGLLLKPMKVVEEGILTNMVADTRFAQYMAIEPTGQLKNMVVGLGSLDTKQLYEAPFVQILAFSDINIDPIAGDIGGEIRLARYYDGKTMHYYTGGAISTNITYVESSMLLSSEVMVRSHYTGPKCVLFKSLEITGA